jgi:S-layer protein (TIGR01567 family)
MDKQMVILIAIVAVMSIMPASAGTTEIRGEVVQLTGAQSSAITWDASNFAAFWYDQDDDQMGETLTIAASTLTGPDTDRTIDEDCMAYQTSPVYQEYELYENKGLTVGGDAGYYLEGWAGERYAAINGSADKICELLVEFEDGDRKTLATGEEWNLGGGFSLTAAPIDVEGAKVWFHLSKDGGGLDESVVSVGEVYTYTADIGDEDNVPVFSCYVGDVFRGKDANIVQIKYVFLIDDDVLDVYVDDWYGAMSVVSVSPSKVTFRNHDLIDLNPGAAKRIMGNMHFKTADDGTAIRFCPFVERTNTERCEIRGMVQNLVGAQPAAITWDASNFAAFWYDLDGNQMTETLTLAASTLTGPDTDRTIDEDCLTYQTYPVYQEYELHENEGLTVDGDTGYYLEGWTGDAYVAINNRADKLCKLLVEFEDDERKTLDLGEAWEMGGGFALEAQIDYEGKKVWFQLNKDGEALDGEVVLSGEVYTYTADIGGEYDVPVFSCYVGGIFKEHDIVQIKYVFLIDNEVLDINTGKTYGVMEVKTASSSHVILRNDCPIDLAKDSAKHIMGKMYVRTADNDTTLRFYPFGGAPPDMTVPVTDFDSDGVPYAWDEEPDTPAGYWTDSGGRGRMLGDMNGDGRLTSVDALMILQAAVGNI